VPKLGYVVYKLSFPNGKIYVGKDIGGSGHSLRYFGSWNNNAVENDFSPDELRSFTVTKTILFESLDKTEVTQQEALFIRKLQSNNPDIGYNLSHRRRSPKSQLFENNHAIPSSPYPTGLRG
jgi:hypothetical protein